MSTEDLRRILEAHDQVWPGDPIDKANDWLAGKAQQLIDNRAVLMASSLIVSAAVAGISEINVGVASAAAPEAPAGMKAVVVQRGDTLTGPHGLDSNIPGVPLPVAEGQTVKASAIKNPNQIYVGETIYLPIGQSSNPQVAPEAANSANSVPTATHPGKFLPGQNVSMVAKQEGFSLSQFAADNPDVKNLNVVFPNRVYNFPGPASPVQQANSAVSAPSPLQSHPEVIHPGDTVYALGQKYNFSVNQFTAVNPGVDPSLIKAGGTYNIPGPTPVPELKPIAPATSPETAHVVVRPGDTEWSLAQKAGNPGLVNQIESDNPGVKPASIQPGQTLNVPPSVAQAEAAAPPPPAPTKPSPVPTIPAPIPEAKIAPIEAPAGTPYLERYVIGILQQLAQRFNLPIENFVTPEHVTALIAWAWLEQGDIDNRDTFNIFNTGINDTSLLATANNASGLQAFKSEVAGETGTADTMLGSFQNRLVKVLSDSSSTAEDFMQALTYFQDYSGNHPWAEADDPAAGYSQTTYHNSLLSRLADVRSNYAFYATVPLGGAYDKNQPHVSDKLLQFNGKSAINPPATTSTTTTSTTDVKSPSSAN